MAQLGSFVDACIVCRKRYANHIRVTLLKDGHETGDVNLLLKYKQIAMDFAKTE